MPVFSRPDISEIILQSGQLLLQGIQHANQLQFEREQFALKRKEYDDLLKIREQKIQAEQAKLEAETFTAQAKAIEAGVESRVAVATEGTKKESAALALEKLQQDVDFERNIQPLKLEMERLNVTLKQLDMADVGSSSEVLDKQLKKLNVMSRQLSLAQDAAKEHVRRPAVRDEILNTPSLKKEYGSREYGWFYMMREELNKAASEPSTAQRRRMYLNLGVPEADAPRQSSQINNIINTYERKISDFVGSSIDVSQVPLNLGPMSKDIAYSLGTGVQNVATAQGATAQTPEQVQMEKINQGGEAGASEVMKMAADQSRKNGLPMAASIQAVLNSISDQSVRSDLQTRLKAVLKK